MGVISKYTMDAFKSLNLLEDTEFDLFSKDSFEKLGDFLEDDVPVDVNVIDMEAGTSEEVKDSYVGDAILECPICHTHIFKTLDQVVLDQENPDVCNVGEPCPVCAQEDGFTIVGKVAPFEEETEEEVAVETEPEDDVDVEVTQKEEVKESIRNKIRGRKLNESRTVRESQELDERLPADLARAYKRSNYNDYADVMTGKRSREHEFATGDPSKMTPKEVGPYINYEDAEYTEITPEQAKQLPRNRWKDLRMLDGADLVVLTPAGKVNSRVNDSMSWELRRHQTAPEVFDYVDKIYITNEKSGDAFLSADQLSKRARRWDGTTGGYFTVNSPEREVGKHDSEYKINKNNMPWDARYLDSSRKDLERYQAQLAALEAEYAAGDLSPNDYKRRKEIVLSNIKHAQDSVAKGETALAQKKQELQNWKARDRYYDVRAEMNAIRQQLSNLVTNRNVIQKALTAAQDDLHKVQTGVAGDIHDDSNYWWRSSKNINTKKEELAKAEAELEQLLARIEQLRRETSDDAYAAEVDKIEARINSEQDKLAKAQADIDTLLKRAPKAEALEEKADLTKVKGTIASLIANHKDEYNHLFDTVTRPKDMVAPFTSFIDKHADELDDAAKTKWEKEFKGQLRTNKNPAAFIATLQTGDTGRPEDRKKINSSLIEGRWKYKLKSGEALRRAVEEADDYNGETDAPFDGVLTALMNCIDELRDALDEDDFDWSFADIENDAEMWLGDPEATEDDIDYILSNFYDSCDANDIWVSMVGESKKINRSKKSLTESVKFIYEFPHLTREDIESASYFGLADVTDEIVSTMDDSYLDVGDVYLRGDLSDLRSFARDYLDYQLVDGYLFNSDWDVVDLDDLDTEDLPEAASKTCPKCGKEICECDKTIQEDVDLNKVDEIANRYNTSQPVSGSWKTEAAHELMAIRNELGLSFKEAVNVMVNHLGFDKDDLIAEVMDSLDDLHGKTEGLVEDIERATVETPDQVITVEATPKEGMDIDVEEEQAKADEETEMFGLGEYSDEEPVEVADETEEEMVEESLKEGNHAPNESLTEAIEKDRKLVPGDTIVVKGTRAVIKDILSQDVLGTDIYIEFVDDKGNYRSWKSSLDGGTVIYKESLTKASDKSLTESGKEEKVTVRWADTGLSAVEQDKIEALKGQKIDRGTAEKISSAVGSRLNSKGYKLKDFMPKIDFDNETFICNVEKIDESLKEDIEKATIETEDQVIEVKAENKDETEEVVSDEEMIAPISDEDIAEIEASQEEIPTEEPAEEPAEQQPEDEFSDEEFNFDEVDEIQEESFNRLTNKFLTKTYSNIQSFKLTEAKMVEGQLQLEGLITFKSGKTKPTSFQFEHVANNSIAKSRIRMVGLNETLTTKPNAFVLKATVNGKKLMAESLRYNYPAKSKSSSLTEQVKVVKGLVK